MELYERVIKSMGMANQLTNLMEAEPPFMTESIGSRSIILRRPDQGNLSVNLAADPEEAEQIVAELNAIWRRLQDQRIDRLKQKFMEKFLKDEQVDDG